MTLRQDYLPLAGGLDEASGRTAPQPGRLLSVENFEISFGDPGYRRIAGYERYDGRAAPSDATYTIIPFDTGSAAINVGDTVTTASGSGYVLRVDITSGSWGANAAGNLIVTAVTGSFADNEALQVSAVTKALVNGTGQLGSAGDAAYTSDTSLAREYYRGLIAKPTGEGAILGVKIYNGAVYCVRNIVGGASATLWKSTGSGWTSIRTGLRPGGSVRMFTASFSGAAGALALFGVDGKNRFWRWDGTTFTFGPAVYSSEGTSTSAVTIGTGAKSLTITEATRSWVGGESLIAYSASNAANSMTGTVTSYSAGVLTLNVTSTTGSGTINDWHVCTTAGTDRPFAATVHKNYLWLAYPLGQLQSSNVGDPMTFSTTASLIGVSDEMVDLKTLRGDTLAVMCQNKVMLLYGSGGASDPWALKLHSESSGVKGLSTQEVSGNAIYISDAGIMTLAGSQSFGDFDAANMSLSAQSSLNSVMRAYKCTSVIKRDSQYRIYGYDKQVLCMAWNGVVQSNTVAYTRLRYLHQAVCSDTALVGTDEFVVFGTDDGWVMRERVGTTFDGTAITAFLRTTYWHNRSPQQKKRFRKITVEADAQDAVTIQMRQDFDFQGPDYATGITADALPSGGLYDIDYWNEFFWSNPEAAQMQINVDGVGSHMSLLFYNTADCRPFSIYGVQMQYSPIGLKR